MIDKDCFVIEHLMQWFNEKTVLSKQPNLVAMGQKLDTFTRGRLFHTSYPRGKCRPNREPLDDGGSTYAVGRHRLMLQ